MLDMSSCSNTLEVILLLALLQNNVKTPQSGKKKRKRLMMKTTTRGLTPRRMPFLIPTHKRHGLTGLDKPLSREQFLPFEHEPFIPWTGSRRLLLGVLQEALRSFLQHRSARSRLGKRAFREAQAWIWEIGRAHV